MYVRRYSLIWLEYDSGFECKLVQYEYVITVSSSAHINLTDECKTNAGSSLC